MCPIWFLTFRMNNCFCGKFEGRLILRTYFKNFLLDSTFKISATSEESSFLRYKCWNVNDFRREFWTLRFSDESFAFTSSLYNVSLEENSNGLRFAVSKDAIRMGVPLLDPKSTIRFKIAEVRFLRLYLFILTSTIIILCKGTNFRFYIVFETSDLESILFVKMKRNALIESYKC